LNTIHLSASEKTIFYLSEKYIRKQFNFRRPILEKLK
jgi:hypothetical protein